MAAANCTNQATATRPSRPMEFEPMWWGDYYNGTMPQLLDTGKFRPEWFPGMPGNKPTSKTMKGIEFEGRAIPELHIWRKDGTRRRFTVWASIDEHEQDLRRYQKGLQEAHAKSMERATAWLRSMVKSKEQFVAMNTYTLKHMIGMHIERMKSEAGYSFSDEAMANIRSAMDALAESLKTFEVDYSPDEHEADRHRLAVDAFEHQGMGRLIDQHQELGIDREAEKAKFVAEALAIPVEGYYSAAIGEYLNLC